MSQSTFGRGKRVERKGMEGDIEVKKLGKFLLTKSRKGKSCLVIFLMQSLFCQSHNTSPGYMCISININESFPIFTLNTISLKFIQTRFWVIFPFSLLPPDPSSKNTSQLGLTSYKLTVQRLSDLIMDNLENRLYIITCNVLM